MLRVWIYTFHCRAFSSSMISAISGSISSSGAFSCFIHWNSKFAQHYQHQCIKSHKIKNPDPYKSYQLCLHNLIHQPRQIKRLILHRKHPYTYIHTYIHTQIDTLERRYNELGTYSSTSFFLLLSCLAGQRGLQIKRNKYQ